MISDNRRDIRSYSMAHNYTVFQYFAVLVLLKYENSVILTVPEYHLYAAVTHAEALNNQYCTVALK